jgi:hypothetical protein
VNLTFRQILGSSDRYAPDCRASRNLFDTFDVATVTLSTLNKLKATGFVIHVRTLELSAPKAL